MLSIQGIWITLPPTRQLERDCALWSPLSAGQRGWDISAGREATLWEGSLEDYQGEGTPYTAAAAFISLLVICQAGPGHADCH